MSTEATSGFQFTDEDLGEIISVLPADVPPARRELLRKIMRIWAVEDLSEHLSRASRKIDRQRQGRFKNVKKRAGALLTEIDRIPDEDLFIMALCLPTNLSAGLKPEDIIARQQQRLDEALVTLADLVANLGGQSEIPPDSRMRTYLIVRDVAGIFALVTGLPATRRINPHGEKEQAYGPFCDFLNEICMRLPNVRSLDQGNKDVQKYKEKEASPFIVNLERKHRDLWRKLKSDVPLSMTSDDQITIRRAGAADIDAIIEILQAVAERIPVKPQHTTKCRHDERADKSVVHERLFSFRG